MSFFDNELPSLLSILNHTQLDKLKLLFEEFKREGFTKTYSYSTDIDKIIKKFEDRIEYESNRKIREDNINYAISKNETTVPLEHFGVHRTHCCLIHGCKYGDRDCPVEMELIKQDYPCESCDWENSQRNRLNTEF